jgi:OOP family OmpA-OmpF porin
VGPQHGVRRAGWLRWLSRTAAALFALALWLWLRGTVETVGPQLTLHNRDGTVTYSGVVHHEATQTAVLSALRATFGDANIRGDIRIDRTIGQPSWLPHLNVLFASLKRPDVDFSLDGETIRVGGWLSAAERQALIDRLHAIFGAHARIGALGDPAAEAVRTANDQAARALTALGTSGPTPGALVDAMNLSIINFRMGSADIPPESMNVLRLAAAAINRTPAVAMIEVGGHTDNAGDSARNLSLSWARADAVTKALVTAGVPASMLTPRGYGGTRPRATNDTEYGRFQNRRIEYTVIQSGSPRAFD